MRNAEGFAVLTVRDGQKKLRWDEGAEEGGWFVGGNGSGGGVNGNWKVGHVFERDTDHLIAPDFNALHGSFRRQFMNQVLSCDNIEDHPASFVSQSHHTRQEKLEVPSIHLSMLCVQKKSLSECDNGTLVLPLKKTL